MLYKYPHREFPYAHWSRRTGGGKAIPHCTDFELLDTGIFDDDRYWDVFVEYAKASPDEHSHAASRSQSRTGGRHYSPATAALFRNTCRGKAARGKPELTATNEGAIGVTHPELASSAALRRSSGSAPACGCGSCAPHGTFAARKQSGRAPTGNTGPCGPNFCSAIMRRTPPRLYGQHEGCGSFQGCSTNI